MPKAESKEVTIYLLFQGTVTVYVPEHLSDIDAKMLARHFALSRILATMENPDPPDDLAFDEYESHCSAEAKETAEQDWDRLRATVCSGWSALD
jgi:hypothetical protein